MAVLVKTINGLAYASVKTRNGLAVASIKNINGLDVTSGSGPTGTEWVTSYIPVTSLRNDFTGALGFKMTPTIDINITALGRWVVLGNSQSHNIVVYDGVGVPLASSTIDTSGKPAGAFTYANLAIPCPVYAGQDYYVLSSEILGGDEWYDWQGASTTSDSLLTRFTYTDDYVNFYSFGSGGQMWVGVSFYYTPAVSLLP